MINDIQFLTLKFKECWFFRFSWCKVLKSEKTIQSALSDRLNVHFNLKCKRKDTMEREDMEGD